MKRLILVLMIVFLTACTSETKYGKCLGVDDLARQDTSLVYNMNTGNVIVGLFFVETVIVPAYVLLEETFCPIAKKDSVVS